MTDNAEEQVLTENEKTLIDLYAATPKPPSKPCVFIVSDNDGKMLVAMDTTGNLMLGDSYKPDVAAQEFWSNVVKSNPVVNRFEQLYQEVDRLKIECYDLRRINAELRQKLDAK